jgi:hypothetical protein
MNLATIKHAVGSFQASFTDNPLAMWGGIFAVVLMLLIFGGLAFNAYIDWKRERQKAQAVERLHKHLQSLPVQKS